MAPLQMNLLRRVKNFKLDYFIRAICNKSIKIGCSSGFWGDTPTAAGQLIENGKLDFLVLDYLSEITISLLVAAKQRNPSMGFTPDFVDESVGPYFKEIKHKGIRVITNAGGINPLGCSQAVQAAIKKLGIEMKIAVVTGDDLMPKMEEIILDYNLPRPVHSMNAYLGAGPIAKALDDGAEIVITGRCTDSALVLGPLVHYFGWKWNNYDLLSSGSLAGHLIECGAQVTGGTFTDWHLVDGWHNNGFPIAECYHDGDFVISKPKGTGGLISQATVTEQLLYEIGDPGNYLLPDVICDWRNVFLCDYQNGVKVTGAKGRAPTDLYKVCATYLDGFKATAVAVVIGPKSVDKAHRTGEAILERCENLFNKLKLPPFKRTHLQVIGSGASYGKQSITNAREGVLWLSVHHDVRPAVDIFAREIASAGTGMAPGLTVIVGGRPKSTPLLRLTSFLYHKQLVNVEVNSTVYEYVPGIKQQSSGVEEDVATELVLKTGDHTYRLEELAYTRSGDKGDTVNIGVAARHPKYLPYLRAVLTEETVGKYFDHVFDSHQKVKRYDVPGVHAMNFVLENALGGGGIASLRPDPQGKGFGQILQDFQLHNLPTLQEMKE